MLFKKIKVIKVNNNKKVRNLSRMTEMKKTLKLNTCTVGLDLGHRGHCWDNGNF